MWASSYQTEKESLEQESGISRTFWNILATQFYNIYLKYLSYKIAQVQINLQQKGCIFQVTTEFNASFIYSMKGTIYLYIYKFIPYINYRKIIYVLPSKW